MTIRESHDDIKEDFDKVSKEVTLFNVVHPRKNIKIRSYSAISDLTAPYKIFRAAHNMTDYGLDKFRQRVYGCEIYTLLRPDASAAPLHPPRRL